MLFIHIRVYWENPLGNVKKLNEFVRDVDEADGDIYGIGTYEAY